MAILRLTDQGTGNGFKYWNEAASCFEGRILGNSPLAAGAQNQVVLWGTTDIGGPGMTMLYIATDNYTGCQIGDHTHFVEVWNYPYHNVRPGEGTAVATRIVIEVDLSKVVNLESIYATLLHEWYVHAAKWAGVIESIRGGELHHALAWVQGDGHARRNANEHKQFANSADNALEAYTEELNLNLPLAGKVVALLQTDRNRYNRQTGEVIG